MRVTTSQYKIIGKIKFAQSKRFSPEHNLPIIGTSSILARGRSRLLPSDPPFILKIHVLFLYS